MNARRGLRAVDLINRGRLGLNRKRREFGLESADRVYGQRCAESVAYVCRL